MKIIKNNINKIEKEQEQEEEEGADPVCPYPQRHRMRRPEDDCGHPGEQPAGGWIDRDTGGAQAVHDGPVENRGLNFLVYICVFCVYVYT